MTPVRWRVRYESRDWCEVEVSAEGADAAVAAADATFNGDRGDWTLASVERVRGLPVASGASAAERLNEKTGDAPLTTNSEKEGDR